MTRSLWQGATLGATVAAGFTLARWATAEPWAPVLVPWDLALCIAVFVAAALLGRSDSSWRRVGPALLFGVLAWAWLENADVAGAATSRRIGWALAWLLAAGVLAARLVRLGSRPALRLPEAGLLASCALAVSVAGHDVAAALSIALPVALAFAFATGLPAPAPEYDRRSLAAAALALAAIGLCATAIRPGSGERTPLSDPAAVGSPEASAGAPSVLLIVLDTLRRDHLSLYGYARKTTPRIDAWAAEAAVFEAMTSATSWTLPSHASMFTGLAPRTHGAHAFRRPGVYGSVYPPSDEAKKLAEIASRAGITTGAISANHWYLAPINRLDRGFDTYWIGKPRRGFWLRPIDPLAERLAPFATESIRWSYHRAPRITDNAIRWLDAAGSRRFFLFVNYMDVHAPSHTRPTAEVPARHAVDKDDFDPVALARGAALAPELREAHLDDYDRELIGLDTEVGRLLDHLEDRGLASNTIVIVTSDHGEAFGEHGIVGHARDLTAELIDVPLIVRGPGIAPGRFARPVSSVDLFPTILEGMGLPVPGDIDGVSIFDERARPIVAELYAAENGNFIVESYAGRWDRNVFALRDGPYTLLRDSRGGLRLFDRSVDPGETRNLARERNEHAASLHARLEDWLRAHPPLRGRKRPSDGTTGSPPEPGAAPDGEMLEQLRALGYAD